MKGPSANELSFPAGHRTARFVEHGDIHAEPRALDLTAPYRGRRIAEHEARDDVGAPRDRGEMDVRLDLAVDVVEAFGNQRRAGGKHGLERLEPVRATRAQAGLGDAV